jgi:hypothetical protein
MTDTRVAAHETRTHRRIKYLSGLVWHAGAFLIINASFWLADVTLGQPGVQWAFWITAFWGFALAFHTLAFYVDSLQLEEWRARQFFNDQPDDEPDY